MRLSSDIKDYIFSYLIPQELCACFATCKYWYASKISETTSILIWFNIYKNLVESSKMIPHTDNFPWRKKVCDLYAFINNLYPFTLTDTKIEIKPENALAVSLPSSYPALLPLPPPVVDNTKQPAVRLVCRSGHTASLFYTKTNQEIIVLFGGATHFYTFVNTYDILSVKDGIPIRTYAAVTGDVPTARWLHRACSYENNARAVVFGGQLNCGTFSNEVYLFTVKSGDLEGATDSG